MELSWKDQKDHLCNLIKQVSDIHGGEDREGLIAYCKDVIKLYRDNLSEPIACFEALINQAKDCGWIKHKEVSLRLSMEPQAASAPQNSGLLKKPKLSRFPLVKASTSTSSDSTRT